MSKKTKRRIIAILITAITAICLLSLTAFATGDVAGAVQNTWDAGREQIKSIVNGVVIPVILVILAGFFIATAAMQGLHYRKNKQVDLTVPGLLLGGLIFISTAPLYIWDIIGF